MQNDSYPTIKDFVLQQAQQKAFETMVLGLKDFQKQKHRIVEEKKESIHTQYEKRVKESNASKRIQRSSLINGSRMRKMQQRHLFTTSIMKITQQRLLCSLVQNQAQYKSLLKNLILQGMIKMLQPKIYIRCLKRDQKLIQSIVNQCKKDFKKLVEKDCIDPVLGEVELSLDSRYFLRERKLGAEASQYQQKDQVCFGGLVLTNQDGLIVCKNTLDARLQLAYQQLLPDVRRELFG